MIGEQLSRDLMSLLGKEGFIRLTEEFGGTRLYITQTPAADHAITKAIGGDLAQRLAERYSPAVLRIPLAREIRARHYRAIGCSNGRIASKLGMTESGVDKMFARMERPPIKGSAQLTLGI